MSRFIIKSIPFEARLAHDAKQILARDQARAKKLIAGLKPHGPSAFHSMKAKKPNHGINDPQGSLDVTEAGVAYTVPVGVGDPPTEYSLLLDTTGSNTWIGADKDYNPSSTSFNKEKTFDISYESGDVTGAEYLDQVTLGGNLVAQKQVIGVASNARGFSGVDGILGIGPANLTSGSDDISPVTENLFAAGVIPTVSIAMSYSLSTNKIANGELTLGATDTAKFIGSINYVPITTSAPSDRYWGIDGELSYGGDIPLLGLTSGVVDIGTTFLLLASDAFMAYRCATGAVEDGATGLLTVTVDQFMDMESVFFIIGSESYELTPNAQIWPRALNEVIGGEKDKIYLIITDMDSQSGSGLDFMGGFTFLQRFYSVFDTTNCRFGLARTVHTTAEIN